MEPIDRAIIGAPTSAMNAACANIVRAQSRTRGKAKSTHKPMPIPSRVITDARETDKGCAGNKREHDRQAESLSGIGNEPIKTFAGPRKKPRLASGQDEGRHVAPGLDVTGEALIEEAWRAVGRGRSSPARAGLQSRDRA